MYKIFYTPQAQKDVKKFKHSKLKEKIKTLLDLIKEDPYTYPPTFELLQGNLKGFVSRRINKQHRLVYQVYENEKIIKILKIWTHYE